MSRYFVDTKNGDFVSVDKDGQEFATRERISAEALRALADISRDEAPDGDQNVTSVKVKGEDGRPVFYATLTMLSVWLDDGPG